MSAPTLFGAKPLRCPGVSVAMGGAVAILASLALPAPA